MTIVQAINFAERLRLSRPDLLPGTSLPILPGMCESQALSALESLANLRRHLQQEQPAQPAGPEQEQQT